MNFAAAVQAAQTPWGLTQMAACQATIAAAAPLARSPGSTRHAAPAAAAAWLPRRAAHPSRRLPPLQRLRPTAAADNRDSDVAVFRFTLGNDAADAAVPRVVGVVGAALLVLNHFLGGEEASEAQASVLLPDCRLDCCLVYTL